MPLLAREAFILPDDLLTRDSAPEGDEACWWVLHARPRAEKALARRFCRWGQAFFLPVYEKQWCARGRRQRSFLSLFPGYVFLYGDRQARLRALETNQVVQALAVPDQMQLRHDLERVYRLILSGNPLTPEAHWEPGRRVSITEGALAGLEGQVLRHGKGFKLLVEVSLLQRGVSVELEEWMLGPAAECFPLAVR